MQENGQLQAPTALPTEKRSPLSTGQETRWVSDHLVAMAKTHPVPCRESNLSRPARLENTSDLW